MFLCLVAHYIKKVRASNGVFNSSVSSTQTNSTWPRPPPPQLISVTTESVVAVVDLSQTHKDIHQLYVEVYMHIVILPSKGVGATQGLLTL